VLPTHADSLGHCGARVMESIVGVLDSVLKLPLLALGRITPYPQSCTCVEPGAPYFLGGVLSQWKESRFHGPDPAGTLPHPCR